MTKINTPYPPSQSAGEIRGRHFELGGLAVPRNSDYRLAATRPTPSAFLPTGRLMSNDSGNLALNPSGSIHGLGSTSQLGVVSTDLLRKRSRKSRGKVSPINLIPNNNTPSTIDNHHHRPNSHHRHDASSHYHNRVASNANTLRSNNPYCALQRSCNSSTAFCSR